MDKQTKKGLLNLGIISGIVAGGTMILNKLFGERNNPENDSRKGSTKYVVRISEHIDEDIERNWSSWNYGLEGFEGTEEEFEAYLDECREDGETIFISGFEIFPKDFDSFKFGELHENYWVAIDYRNGKGLSCNIIDAASDKEAISKVTNDNFHVDMGDGDTVDCSNAEAIYSEDEMHLLKIEE